MALAATEEMVPSATSFQILSSPQFGKRSIVHVLVALQISHLV